MRRSVDRLGPLGRYSFVSERISKSVIGAYSTSFGLATRLLGPRHRDHVRNIYALVRVADELVDGVAAEAGVAADQQRRMLDQLEAETESGMRVGYSSNPIIHAFARTARAAGFGAELTRPFFASMRTDLQLTPADPKVTEEAQGVGFDADDHAVYVYGSAEVVGLMCLRIFIRDEDCSSDAQRRLVHGARSLGAAFQNVNFLRDLGDDTQRLGRSYLSETGHVDARAQEQWIDAIRTQLDAAAQTIPLLPGDARVAVLCALRLFAALTDRLAVVPAAELPRRRIRVAGPRKAALVLRAFYEVRMGAKP
ncbi:phytoene/squalene synthase family protein [Brevibacterium atlanticum]|uniref:phytoene/squalene synthase family protein n=1 Tax=Brevibacterium atlanticum TaxID=2697563 RepID=UPI001423096F|nr:squalene/phytoene synthase family protein [Brevibacterium atlanticum]